ncbi:MAG TPA: sigma-70 family RNA polymerase sigma factor [Kofleriaceae bacterium]|nr:sigma-70 family RNA polymerase sigma factor [Kofleriaceae bacterium]
MDVLADLDGLRALARSLVHGDADAEDLVQETAIAALEHPPATDRPVRPWLAAVLRNRWKMDRRGEARRRLRDAVAVPDQDGAPAADELLERARLLERLAKALVALDEPYRATVIQRYLDGKSAADLARAERVPAATVRWRLATGLAKLREALDESQPRAKWMRVLAPAALAQGATIVKTKTWLIVLIVMALCAGGAAIFVASRGGGGGADDEAPAIATSPRPGVTSTSPTAITLPHTDDTAAPPVVDPLPGQGRATVERASLPGGALAGRVINWSTGEGVAGAELTFSGGADAITVRSDRDGSFALAPPSPGRLTLATISAPGFLPYAPEWLHSTVHVELARDRRVRGVTIFLFPAVDYHGVVVDGEGKKIANARVKLLGTPAGEQQIDRLPTEWTTDRDGAFTFHAADDAVLEASANGARGWGRLDGNVAITHKLTITIGDAPARDATITGHVVDGAGHPLPDVLVRAMPGGPPEDQTVRAPSFALSGGDGAFALANLDRGHYEVSAADDDGDRAPVELPDVTGGTKDLTLTLADGAILEGAAQSPTGEPIPAFTLLVSKKDGALRELVSARSIVDDRGRFRVHVAPGDYELYASASGWAPSAPTAATAPGKTTLTLSAGATLRGTVVSKADGKGVPYARVMREAPGGGASAQPANAGTVTRTDGTFELTGIPPGPVSITVGAGDFHPRIEAGMTATDGAELGPITIALTPLGKDEQPTLELVGIGVALAPDGDALKVTRVIEGGGAEAAGVVVGDHIVAVDGAPVTAIGLEGAIARIRGNPGTTVVITLAREAKMIPLTIERRAIKS